MAEQTPCQTPGAVFHTRITRFAVSVSVELPFDLEITPQEAETLDKLLHNQFELVLRQYFPMFEKKKTGIALPVKRKSVFDEEAK